MEGTYIFLEERRAAAGRQPVDKMQRNLFDAIRKGDLEAVRCSVSLLKPKWDVNCVNRSGKTALEVAGDLTDLTVRNDMIRALLIGGADLELALLHAVHDNNAKSVEILVSYHEVSVELSSYAVDSLKHQRYVTPLILAAYLQNFPMVKLLLEHGFSIPDPKICL